MDHFWLTDEQFAKIAPLLPNDTRGKEPVDDRRVISGIVDVRKPGGRWTGAPREVYGPKKAVYNRFVRWAVQGSGSGCSRPSPKRVALSGTDRLHCREGPPLRCGGQRRSRANLSVARGAGARRSSTPSPTAFAARSSSC